MTKKREYVAVWLYDAYARDFVGPPPSEDSSRWVASRELHTREESVDGIWLAVDKLDEQRSG